MQRAPRELPHFGLKGRSAGCRKNPQAHKAPIFILNLHFQRRANKGQRRMEDRLAKLPVRKWNVRTVEEKPTVR